MAGRNLPHTGDAMNPEVLAQSKEARRIYMIASEVRAVNPERAGRLVARSRRLVAEVRGMLATVEAR